MLHAGSEVLRDEIADEMLPHDFGEGAARDLDGFLSTQATALGVTMPIAGTTNGPKRARTNVRAHGYTKHTSRR